MSKTSEEQARHREYLLECIKPGDTIYTKVLSVSRSGMSRKIMVLIAGTDGEIRNISWNVAKACGMRPTKDHDGITIGGCGMDMGFAIVYDLSYTLFPDGFECSGPGCPSNEHVNGDRNYAPHRHVTAGYALRHEWL